MTGRVEGKTALIIGAGSSGPGWGNGKAAAALLAREGAKTFCVDIDEAAAHETARVIRESGGVAEPFCADASQAEDVERVIEACVERFGRIDILDNNVGIVEVGGVVDLSESSWDRVLATNLTSVFLTMKHTIPVMEEQGGGSIVNISSIASIRYLGVPYAGYFATKAAINNLTRATAAQYAGKQIRVNAVLPGLMKTPMVEHADGLVEGYHAADAEAMWRARAAQCPMGHMGDAWDVAYAVLFLASDEAKYVTGAELVVDGGMTLKCD